MWKPHFLLFPSITSTLAQHFCPEMHPSDPISSPIHTLLLGWVSGTVYWCATNLAFQYDSVSPLRVQSAQHQTSGLAIFFEISQIFFLLEILNQYGVCRSQHDLTLSESCLHALWGRSEAYSPSASFWFPCVLTTQSLALSCYCHWEFSLSYLGI